jgi:hypothetical protein
VFSLETLKTMTFVIKVRAVVGSNDPPERGSFDPMRDTMTFYAGSFTQYVNSTRPI